MQVVLVCKSVLLLQVHMYLHMPCCDNVSASLSKSCFRPVCFAKQYSEVSDDPLPIYCTLVKKKKRSVKVN